MVEVLYHIVSNRVKSSSFHPRRTWLLTGLHTGVIQLWDYKIGSLLETFHGCEGPVRSISFHSDQPLFVSAGDDHKIRVWNYQQKRCLFTLKGHSDYIRSAFFHKVYPWIISASDDQTVKIWNWQSRKCLTTIYGHSHYVMCAKFHPSSPIAVSVSLDQTVRIWNLSGLIQKGNNQNIANTIINNPLVQMDSLMLAIAEGHHRGINWVSFHHTRDYILTASDDRHIILWRYSEVSFHEVETFYGHTNNVTCVEFVPDTDLFLSCSEDGNFRLWNFERRCSLRVFNSESGRVWNCIPHPSEGIGAFSTDKGFFIVRYQVENLSFYTTSEGIYYTRGLLLRYFNIAASTDKHLYDMLGVAGRRATYHQHSYNHGLKRLISCSSAEYDKDEGRYVDLIQVTSDFKKFSPIKRYLGKSAVWLNSFSFAVATNEQVAIMDKDGVTLYTVPGFDSATQLFNGAFAHDLIICQGPKVTLFNLEEKKMVCSETIPDFISLSLSTRKEYIAVITGGGLLFYNNKMQQICSINEHYKVKSGVWADIYSDIFIYATSVHIKYFIVGSQDHGIIRTLEFPLQIALIKSNKIYGFDQEEKPRVLMLDDVEIKFKMALMNKNYDHVMKIIKNSDLVGQSLISFLQKKGYSEIALHYIKDKKSQFALALKCGNIAIAFEAAKALNEVNSWRRLANFAKSVGEFKIAEFSLMNAMDYDELIMLYVSSGNISKLENLKKHAASGNKNTYLKLLLLTNDTENLIKHLLGEGHGYLANAMKFAYNPDENLNTKIILPDIEDKLVLSDYSVCKPFEEDTWPMLNREKSIFEYLAVGIDTKLTIGNQDYEEDEIVLTNEAAGDWDVGDQVIDEKLEQDMVDEDAAWSLDGDIDIPSDTEIGNIVLNPVGEITEVPFPEEIASSEVIKIQSSDLWKAITFGEFDIVTEILRGKGVINPVSMKELLVQYAMLGRIFLSTKTSGCALVAYVDPQCISLNELNQEFQNALNSTTSGNFEQAIRDFRRCVQIYLLLEASSKSEREEAKKILVSSKEYLSGLKIEMSRREVLEKKNNKRACELALYFTTVDMQPKHKVLALRSAMYLLYKEKNYKHCASVARKLLAMGIPTNLLEQTKKIIAVSEKDDSNAQQLEFDPLILSSICSCNLTPLRRGDSVVCCSVCGGIASASTEVKLCPLCELGLLK